MSWALKLILALSLFSVTSCSTPMWRRQPTSEQKPIHFIFTVHGLSGGPKTFGALRDVLPAHLNKLVPSYSHQVITHVYPTGEDHKDTYQFSDRLGQTIQQILRTRNNPKDKISIIAHSQGGIISWIWYLKSLSRSDEFAPYYDDALKVDAIITLGSPIWGSRLANIGNDKETFATLKKWAQKFKVPLPAIGKKELHEMAHGSDTIYRFRSRAIETDMMGRDLPVRTLAVAGVIPHNTSNKARSLGLLYRTLIMAGENILGKGARFRLESDLAVALPLARYGFFYSPPRSKKEKIEIDEFKTFKDPKIDNLVLVESPHITWDQHNFYDIAEVPKECSEIKDGKTCTHPTYPYILNHLSNCIEYTGKCDMPEFHKTLYHFIKSDRLALHTPKDLDPKNLSGYVLDFNLILPENYDGHRAKDLIKYIDFTHSKKGFGININDPSYRFYMNKNGLITSFTKFRTYINPKTGKKENHLRLTWYGYIIQDVVNFEPPYKEYADAMENGFKLPLKITLPNLPAKYVDIKVKPTYSSFIEIDYTN